MGKPSAEAAAIIEALKGRAGAIKVAECDDAIVLDAEAFMVSSAEI